MFSDVFEKSSLGKQLNFFKLYVVLLVQGLIKFFLQCCCSRILLFLKPFITQWPPDPYVEKIVKPLIAENLSRTTYWVPQVSEKLKNQLVWKINNAAFVHFGEVSIFGHSVRCSKNWIKVCYETSYSTK